MFNLTPIFNVNFDVKALKVSSTKYACDDVRERRGRAARPVHGRQEDEQRDTGS